MLMVKPAPGLQGDKGNVRLPPLLPVLSSAQLDLSIGALLANEQSALWNLYVKWAEVTGVAVTGSVHQGGGF